MMTTTMEIEDYYLDDAGEIPNNLFLPLLIYRNAFAGSPEPMADEIEKVFAANEWPPAWRYGIYDFPHYHSTAHEVIGVYRGHATVRFGHTGGIERDLSPGDIVVIPAGVGHQCLSSSPDFHAVGAYPEGQHPDQMRGLPSERPAADTRIDAVPLPATDPVHGKEGPLLDLW